MRSTFPGASCPAYGDARMYDLHHKLQDLVKVFLDENFPLTLVHSVCEDGHEIE